MKEFEMDNITPVEPVTADTGTRAEVPISEYAVEPLEVVETPDARSRLRIYAILVSLYVYRPFQS